MLAPNRTENVMLSRPRRPPSARYYSPTDLLNCDGANFTVSDGNVMSWRDFRFRVDANARKGFPEDTDLFGHAARIANHWYEHVLPGSMKFPQVLVRQMDVSRMHGFCLHGYATALYLLYRHDLNHERLLMIEQAMGWVEWPLDFSESSDWPTLWRLVPMHLEQVRRTGDSTWSKTANAWDESSLNSFLPTPTVGNVEAALFFWLRASGSPTPRWLPIGRNGRARVTMPAMRLAARKLAQLARRDEPIKILVLGHHMGSSMEPFTMLRQALQVGVRLRFDAKFFGQRHPAPGLVCREFGYCDEDVELDSWFKRYESRWLGEYDWIPDGWDEAQTKLAGIVGASSAMTSANMVVCGGPAWFCAMLRAVWSIPMFLYFAWPICPLVPSGFRSHVFAHVRALGQTVHPPTIIVVANWILAAQFALQTRLHVPVQRPHGLHTNQTYAPVPTLSGKPRVMVTRVGQWARISGIALLELTWLHLEQEQRNTGMAYPLELVFLSIRVRGANTLQSLSYAEFAQFHACVFWPWDVMMLLFNELYTMTMPLLVPERRWMHHLMLHALKHTQVNWWHIRESVSGSLPHVAKDPFPLPLPWIGPEHGLEQAAFWYELTDFVQFPHVTYFNSIPEMLQLLRGLDVPSIRAGMREFNGVTLRESVAFYRMAAAELLLNPV